MLPAPLAFAQDAAPPPAAAPAPSPATKPGVFEAIGRWFDEGASNFRDHLRGAKRKMDDLGDDAAANSKGFSEGMPARSVARARSMPPRARWTPSPSCRPRA